MINHQTIKNLLAHLMTDKNDTLLSTMFTGVLAGIALAVKDPKLARTIDHNLRTQWNDTHPANAAVDPSIPYGPGLMGERLMIELNKEAGNSN